MKPFYLLIALCLLSGPAQAARLIPSQVDLAHASAREAALIPWSTPEEGSDFWRKLSRSNVPIYKEMKIGEKGELGRDLYIPNPGIGYWVLGGLSEKALWKTHHEKLEIGDELISATIFKDARGDISYWALWAPANKAYLLKDKMKEFGITPAKVEFTLWEKMKMLSSDLAPYTALAVFGVLSLNLLTLAIGILLLLRCRKNSSLNVPS